MTARVVSVRRHDKLTWVERLYVPMIVKGLWVTSAHFFRNMKGFITGDRKDFVVQYPEQRVDFPDAFRGQPVLVQLENGQPRCVAAGFAVLRQMHHHRSGHFEAPGSSVSEALNRHVPLLFCGSARRPPRRRSCES
jgi:hypothetical protein